MAQQSAKLDTAIEAGSVFGRAGAFLEKHRPVDLFDVDPTVLNRFDCEGDFHQLASGFIGIRVGAGVGVFHSFDRALLGSVSGRAYVSPRICARRRWL